MRYNTPQQQAEFVLQGSAAESGSLYCCQYDNSMFSPYTTIKAPSHSIMPPGPPRLSVEPPAGHILPGQVLLFQCHAPPTSTSPVSFLLLRQLNDPAAPQRQVVHQSTSPLFWVGPVGQGEEGIYFCLYRIAMQRGVQDSAPSSPVPITLAVRLPEPRLSQEDAGLLACLGSPSYPGAHFSLFLQGAPSPVTTITAPASKHSVLFAVSELKREEGGFECQYSVLLGKEWVHSERSAPLTVSSTTGPPSWSFYPKVNTYPSEAGQVDLTMVIGSIAAAVLFLLVVIILGITIFKHVKAAATKRHQREQDLFWQTLHSGNHTVDLTLPRVSINTMEFGAEKGRSSVSEPIYDYPLSTFTKTQY
ncbi:uncharacterized protein LOC143521880 isoform X2 [Brachyhypopomus gauderio]